MLGEKGLCTAEHAREYCKVGVTTAEGEAQLGSVPAGLLGFKRDKSMEDLAHSLQSIAKGDETPPLSHTPAIASDSDSQSDDFVDLQSPPAYSSVQDSSHVPIALDLDDMVDTTATLSLETAPGPRLRRHDRT